MHETTSFATIAASLRINRDIPMKKALVNLSRTIADQCPVSFLIGHVRTTIAAQTHYWTPWHELEDDYTLAIEGNISSANYEQATSKLSSCIPAYHRRFWALPRNHGHIFQGHPDRSDVQTL